jgi:acyl-CoA thioester hydrolase
MNSQPTFSVTQRVRFAETDAMGIVHHANYFLWFEVARVECLRQLGYPYTRMEKEGYGLPVSEVGCRFMRSAKFD